MIFIQTLYIFLLLLATVGCNKSTENPHLIHIDSLIENRETDKAYQELSDYAADMADTTNASELAYYYLLRTKCQDRLQIDFDTEDGIGKSVRFYEKNGNKEKLMQSRYYAGIVQYYGNKKQQAVANIKTAETIAVSLNDVKMQTETSIYLSFINLIEGNLREAQKYIIKALRLSERSGNMRRMAYCYNHLAVIYNDLGKQDSSRYYSDMAINYVKYQEPWEQVNTYNNIAADKLDNHQLDEAKTLLQKSLAIKDIPHTHYLLAELYHEQHDENAAGKEWKKALEERDIRLRTPTLHKYANWLLKTGRNGDASLVYKQIKTLEDSIKQMKQGENILASLHHHERNDLKQRLSGRAIVYATAFLALLCLSFSYYLYARKKLKHKQKRLLDIENRLLILEQQERIWKDSSKRSEQSIVQLHEHIRQLHDKRERELKQLQSTHKRTLNQVKQELDMLKKEFPQRMAKGKEVYEQIVGNQNISQYSKDDRDCFVTYCRVSHTDLLADIDNHNIKGNMALYSILMRLGKNDDEIRLIMRQSMSAFKMMKSRYRQKMDVFLNPETDNIA